MGALEFKEPLPVGPDYTLLGTALSLSRDPVALTANDGALVVVNHAYRERFGSRSPLELGANEHARQGLKLAQTMGLRDGAGCVAGIETEEGTNPVEVDRAGTHNDLLLWRFVSPVSPDAITLAASRLRDRTGDLLSRAGVLAALLDPEGRPIAFNKLFEERALSGRSADEPVFELVERKSNKKGWFSWLPTGTMDEAFVRYSFRWMLQALMNMAFSACSKLVDSLPMASSSHLQALLDMLPIGLALVDRDGRFLTMNDAFCHAAGIKREVGSQLSRATLSSRKIKPQLPTPSAKRAGPGDVGRPCSSVDVTSRRNPSH